MNHLMAIPGPRRQREAPSQGNGNGGNGPVRAVPSILRGFHAFSRRQQGVQGQMDQRAAILDIDGTLVDSNYEHILAWHEAFALHGFVITKVTIHHAIGMGGDQLVPFILRCDDGDPVVQAISQLHDEIFLHKYFHGVAPLPAAQEFVTRLKEAGVLVAVASSANQGEVDHYIDMLSIRDLLDARVDKSEVDRSKPAPTVFAKACKKLHVEPRDAIAVGDSIWDGAPAKALGMPFVAVRTGGFDESGLRSAGAIAVYPDLKAILLAWDASPFGAAGVPNTATLAKGRR
jgi:HAD superfamily hydrolase (TIGR01509 family)